MLRTGGADGVPAEASRGRRSCRHHRPVSSPRLVRSSCRSDGAVAAGRRRGTGRRQGAAAARSDRHNSIFVRQVYAARRGAAMFASGRRLAIQSSQHDTAPPQPVKEDEVVRSVRLSQEGIVFALSVVLFVIFSLTLQNFLTAGNLIALVRSVAILGILGLGMGLVVVGRGIDLAMVATMVVSLSWALALAQAGMALGMRSPPGARPGAGDRTGERQSSWPMPTYRRSSRRSPWASSPTAPAAPGCSRSTCRTVPPGSPGSTFSAAARPAASRCRSSPSR